MKVLVLSHLYPYTLDPTFGHFVHHQVKELTRRCEVVVVSPTPLSPPIFHRLKVRWQHYASKPSATIFEGVEVYYPRYVHLPGKHGFPLAPFFYFLALRNMVQRLKSRFDFNLIHAHTICPDGLPAAWLGRRAGVPVVCTVHGGDINVHPHWNRFTLTVTRWAIRSVDVLIAVSAALKEKTLSLGIPRRDIRLIPNGVDPERFCPVDKMLARAELGLPDSKRILVYASRLDEAKGLSYLLSAFRIVRNRTGDCLLVLVGDGPYKRRLIQQTAELGLEDSVLFTGLTPHAEVSKWMNACDLVVLPSLSEGSPLPVYEALSCGKPIVASNVGGIPELITSDEYGILVPPADSDTLAEALLYGMQKKWYSERIREYGKKYSWANVAILLCNLYQEVLECGP